MTRRSIAVELTRAGEGRPRRRVIRRMVAELASQMHAPEGVPSRFVASVPVAIPAGLDALAVSIDARRWYRFDLPDGRTVLAGGVELAAICGELASLAEAQRAGDVALVERSLSRLCVPSWH